MPSLLWVKMPSTWIGKGMLSIDFSSRREKDVSGEIAALKIYICLCIYSDRKMIPYPPKLQNNPKCSREREFIGSSLTYDQLSEYCTLSRVLVSRGLKKLISCGLINKQGTTRKVTYEITGLSYSGWCKLPCRVLLGINGCVKSFTGLKNRYPSERNGLKLFLYLLSIRQNDLSEVSVSRGKIAKMTGLNVYDIDSSVGVLRSIELIEDVQSLGYQMNSSSPHQESDRLAQYLVKGGQSLNLKK